ncbi:60S Ribosomal protein [Quillaja saponaria]|uniref:60S Ribosomal protein n=1 Tax=Quillaja saponaria TaxID=32244 RepID=A0AAD7L2J8_QUISA|nr:60S Ribosomal protein [Quillaja saponaria]
MAQQEEGWPLGLRPLNAIVGLVRNHDFSGSVSFSTLLTSSPTSSTDSSSALDTESTGSFFHHKSMTLGSLIGVSSILEFSRRSIRGRTAGPSRDKKNHKLKPWLFSLCSKLSTDDVGVGNAPSLGYFLEAERRAAGTYRRNQYPNDFSPVHESNTLFVGGEVASLSAASLVEDGGKDSRSEFVEHGNGYGVPLAFSCLCRQLC